MTETSQNINTQAAIQDLTTFMAEFGAFLSEETKILQAAKYDEAKTLQQKKKEMSHHYHSRIQILVTRREEIRQMPEQVKEKIIKARLKFSKILSENLRTIDAVRQSSERMVNKIIESARDSVSEDAGYNARGQMYSTTSNGQSPVSIRVNEVF